MMEVTATKKFSEYDLTSVYADMTYIDEATQSLLYDWFQFRTVCDDEKFPAFYRRKLMRCEAQYHQLLRLEHSDFDPLVATYHERLTESQNNETDHSTTETSASGTTSDTITKNLTDETVVDKDGTSSNTSSGSGSSSDKSVHAQKNNPSSITYAGATAGELPALDWTYMNTQTQDENSGQSSSSNTSTGATTEDSTSTTTHSGTDSHAGTKSDSSESESNGRKQSAGVVKEISTGRDGLTPQEAFLTARKWIVISDAFDWLKAELNDCFLGIFEI